MEPISSADRLLLILRQRLEQRARAAGARAPGKAADQRPAVEHGTVQALAAIDGADDRQLRRALLQSILAEQFGSEMLNDARFQQVVDRVAETMEEDEAALRLLDRLIGALRRPG